MAHDSRSAGVCASPYREKRARATLLGLQASSRGKRIASSTLRRRSRNLAFLSEMPRAGLRPIPPRDGGD